MTIRMTEPRGPSPSRQLREIIALWEVFHAGFEQALRGLPDAALGFRPQPRMRTLGQLVRHTLMAETYYFSRLPGARRSRPRLPKEFKSKRKLLRAMHLVHNWSLANLGQLSDEELDRQLRYPWLPKMSVRQVLLNLVAHEVHHRAQLYTYVRLWEPADRRYPKPWWIIRKRSALA